MLYFFKYILKHIYRPDSGSCSPQNDLGKKNIHVYMTVQTVTCRTAPPHTGERPRSAPTKASRDVRAADARIALKGAAPEAVLQ